MGEEIINELMGALKFNKSLTDGRHGVPIDDGVPALPTGESAGSAGYCGPRAGTPAAGALRQGHV